MTDDLEEFTPPPPKRETVGKLADLLDRSGIDIEDVARVNRVNAWQGFYKNKIGCPRCGGTPKESGCAECGGDGYVFRDEHVDMVGIQLTPNWADGPEWPVVQQAAPTVVRHTARKAPNRTGKVTVLLPDPQIGYRCYDGGELDPMHDEAAMDVALQMLGAIRPNRVVNLGDFLDMSEWSSKFVVYPEFVQSTQPALDRGHRFLAEQRAAVGPDVPIDLLGGNHDNRLSIAVAKNAKAALRLRQANTPDSWPVLSLPFLLRLDELGVTYTGAYPAGRVRITDAHGRQTPLVALHGERLDMKKQVLAERHSTVQGHAHHFATHDHTFDMPGEEPIEQEAWSVGCLCRTDGAVPSTKGASDDRGRPFKRDEPWQQGIALVIEDEDGWDLTPIRIRDGVARWNGKRYAA